MIKFHLIIGIFLLVSSNVAQEPPYKLFNNKLEGFKVFQNYKKSNTISPLPNVRDDDKRLTLEPEDLIKYYNYGGEKHTTTTSDGYSLGLHRITGNKTHPSPKGKPAVLIQHGLFSSSMFWLISGPTRSLAFLLADQGFDVWLGNFRGCRYSQGHKTLNATGKDYWDFSWHELGIYDLPATIDYILKITGNAKITYIGYSQGTTTSYVMLSERPEYNDKISAMFSLSSVSFWTHVNPWFKFIAKFTNSLHNTLDILRVNKFKPINERVRGALYKYCLTSSAKFKFCKNVISSFIGFSEPQFDPELWYIGLSHVSGISTRQLLHYFQLMSSGRFRQYDYGLVMNKKKYNSVVPPDYKISNIKVPTTVFYASNDLLAVPQDVKDFYAKLPTPKGLYSIEDPTFNHADYVVGKDVKHLLYDRLIPLILKS